MPKIPFDGSKVELWHTREEIMDDYTKESIADILGVGKKPVRPTATRYSYAEEKLKASRVDRAHAAPHYDAHGFITGWDKAADIRVTPEPPVHNTSHMTYLSPELLSHVTVAISVNTSKACIVVNTGGMTSDALMNEFHQVDPKNVHIKYNVQLAVWEIHPGIMGQIKPILARLFKTTTVVGVAKATPATKFDQLLARLDKDDKAKIYKLLAMKYHTDRGGKHDTMVLINQVFKEA